MKMNNQNSGFFKKYLLPGFVFQSVIIAGGYGTGREIVEYFLKFGPIGGLLGMGVTTLIWSVILAIVFEFSRKFRSYDYHTFFHNLLGPFWFLFEIIYILYLFIVLAVIGSAAGVLIKDNFGIPYLAGVVLMFVSVGFLTFKGSRLIEKFFSIWSFLLYGVYGIFLVVALLKFGPLIQSGLSSGMILPKWTLGSMKYALYNLGNIAAVFFCLNHIETRREAVSAGLIGGVIGILPGFFFYMAIVGHYPAVLSEAIPAVFVLGKAGIPVLLIAFQIILLGTLVESGTAFIHSVNERIQVVLQKKGKALSQWQRPLNAFFLLFIALGISTFGLISLIAKGYGAASWGFLAVFIIPVLTIGLYKIIMKRIIK
ncbi:hypothetical protein ACFL6A_02725 [bacterium]